MTKIIANYGLAIMACAASYAATINTTMTVNAALVIGGAGGITANGTATLTNIGNGTFTATLSTSSTGAFTGPFNVILSTGDSISDSRFSWLVARIKIPLETTTKVATNPGVR